MRNYARETKQRVQFIKDLTASSGAKGIVYGNSGGKDSALVGILCKMACDNTLGLIMPCGSKRNYAGDLNDANTIAQQYKIAVRIVDLSPARQALKKALSNTAELTDSALNNIAPRLRMSALYAVAASENRLVAGTGNRSEHYLGYFTKWGDGACDFNVIADLTAGEVLEFLHHLGAPAFLFSKPPSAGLYDGQTDEEEIGVAYSSIDALLLTGKTSERDQMVIERQHRATEHKRHMPILYPGRKKLESK